MRERTIAAVRLLLVPVVFVGSVVVGLLLATAASGTVDDPTASLHDRCDAFFDELRASRPRQLALARQGFPADVTVPADVDPAMTSLSCTWSQPMGDGSPATIHAVDVADRRTKHVWSVVRRNDHLQGDAAWIQMLAENGFRGAQKTPYGFTNAPPPEPGAATKDFWDIAVARWH
jgi:hypothetical protein